MFRALLYGMNIKDLTHSLDYNDKAAKDDVIVDSPGDELALIKLRRCLAYNVAQIGTP